MITEKLQKQLRPWLEIYSGVPLASFGLESMPVLLRSQPLGEPTGLLAIRLGQQSAMVVDDADLALELQPLVDDLHPDTIFSTFGIFELSRLTLSHGISVWGPNWFLFGDNTTVSDRIDNRVEKISQVELTEVDFKEFWHCDPDAADGFGIREDEKIVALATVIDREPPVCEIGMEVSQDSQGKGLGRSVVTAAARWILDTDRVPLAVVAPFNVPSTRTLRSSGLEYMFQCMEGKKGRFHVPPQPLGSPTIGAQMYNYYPEWAMNKEIKEMPDS